MTFLDLLAGTGIAPGEVALCLHKPSDPIARQALIATIEDAPDIFDAYQSTHAAKAEATVKARGYLASFIMTAPGEHTFIGLYRREIGPTLTAKDALSDPLFNQVLTRIEGHRGPPEALADVYQGRTRFHLTPVAELSDLARRLVVTDPGGRAYVRRAETTPLSVREIKRHARVAPAMPAWDALTLSAPELPHLPRDWALRLAEWRGIYLITDETDGARYVGAAYGAENLLGRWRAHTAGPKGITAALRLRNPQRFRFSILDLLAPNADVADVTALEQRWMARLHTKEFGLNT